MTQVQDERVPEAIVDVVVVGGGPAGLSAALWLGRHRRRTVVLDGGRPRNRDVEASHGYLGSDRIRPTELLARARSDLARYPTVTLRPARAAHAAREGERFCVRTEQGAVVRSRRLVLATGLLDELPAIDGLREHWGADVTACPACDGYEARGLATAIVGWGPQVPGFALTVLDWCGPLTVLTGGHELEADRAAMEALERNGVRVERRLVAAFLGPRGALRGVALAGGAVVPCRRVFVNVAHHPSSALAASLGAELDEHGFVVVGPEQESSVPGLYAAGDCSPGFQLVQVAAAQGAVAGIAAAVSLRGEPAVPGTPEPGPDPTEELAPPQ